MSRPTIILLLVLPALSAGAAPDDLDDLLGSFTRDPAPALAFHPLSPEWVGTVETVYTKGFEQPDPPVHIRFTHGFISQDPSFNPNDEPRTSLRIARLRRGKGYVGAEGPSYRSTLPAVQILAKFTTGNEFIELFGPQHGWTDAWGGSGGMHWTLGWTWFTRIKPDQLRYLSLFAMVSSTKDSDVIRIDSLRIREGYFRPADPNSAEEEQKYLRGDVLLAREEAEELAARAKYPQPLRDLLAADEHPDDSDLAHYGTVLQKFRANPDPQLIEQILSRAHEDSVRYTGFLEGIFTDRISSIVPELHDWHPDRKREALGYLIDKLPVTRDGQALGDALEVALKSLGGGKLKFRNHRDTRGIDLEIKLRKDGSTTNYGGIDHSPELIAMAQKELRALVDETLK